MSLFLVVVVLLHFFLAASDGNTPQQQEPLAGQNHRRRIHKGWKACQQHGACWMIDSLPTTALVALLQKQQLDFNNDSSKPQKQQQEQPKMVPDDLYFSKNMATLPDISKVGRDYYTLTYQWQVPRLEQSPLDLANQKAATTKNTIKKINHIANNSNNQTMTSTNNEEHIGALSDDNVAWSGARQILRFSGINYRARAFWNGSPLQEVNSKHNQVDGMFRRRHYDVSTTTTNDYNNNSESSSLFEITIEPPLHPGHPTVPSQQGGNHDLAKDGPTAQFLLGWDWCQAMPDRATGFFGAVEYHVTNSAFAILDPAIQTLHLECNHSHNQCSNITLAIYATIECGGPQATLLCREGTPIVLTVTSDWGEVWTIDTTLGGDGVLTEIQSQNKSVHQPDQVHLWWPHGLGASEADLPHLHSFQFDVKIGSGDGILLSDSVTIQSGIRTIRTHLDDNLKGQVFFVNGQRIYLVGGNWITTDQAMRYSASKERYCNELLLFRHAGLKLVRVWGGSVAETSDFYNCADRLGILVFQEFWMTGDNNGRWAGEYSWPLDYTTYLTSAEDTIRRLRRHPSLLFYGGCNECLAPRGTLNPPMEIDNGIRDLIQKFDPGRFYISSSMGGKNRADTFEDPTLWANRSFSLAFADGPYSFLMPEQYFERNPGLEFKNISIGFQPEIGSTSAPTYNGLLRFMTSEEAESGFPRKNASNDDVGDVWSYHKYQNWKTNSTYDHVYAYLGDDRGAGNNISFPNASEWCAAAQLAAHKQYQHLFEGFISHLFDYTSAVILWKAQSPWPSLRGFLYDWYLESTGTLFGTRAALRQMVSIALDASSWRVRIINRSRDTLSNDPPIALQSRWVTINGTIIENDRIPLSEDHRIPPMSSALFGDENDSVVWPESCEKVCFLHLATNLGSSVSDAPSTWYWIPDPSLTLGNEFAALGRMRSRQTGQASLQIYSCVFARDHYLFLEVSIHVPSEAKEPLFYPTFSLYYADNKPILPMFDNSSSEILILQGETQKRTLRAAMHSDDAATVRVRMDTWNGGTAEQDAHCVKQGEAKVREKAYWYAVNS